MVQKMTKEIKKPQKPDKSTDKSSMKAAIVYSLSLGKIKFISNQTRLGKYAR
jgi:hypothetical protein